MSTSPQASSISGAGSKRVCASRIRDVAIAVLLAASLSTGFPAWCARRHTGIGISKPRPLYERWLDLKRFLGRTALVTGASRGIGAAVACMMAEQGADVVINYRSKGSRAEQVAARVESLGRS